MVVEISDTSRPQGRSLMPSGEVAVVILVLSCRYGEGGETDSEVKEVVEDV